MVARSGTATTDSPATVLQLMADEVARILSAPAPADADHNREFGGGSSAEVETKFEGTFGAGAVSAADYERGGAGVLEPTLSIRPVCM